MTCLTPQQIERLVRNELAPDEARPLGEHAASCPACRQQVEECRANEEFLRGLKRRDGALIQQLPQMRDEATASISLGSTGSLGNSRVDWRYLPHDTIPGYEIVRQLSGGGQGMVYEAIQLATKRTVAIKVLREGPLADERARWRFDREVKLVANMKHPGIVVIHDSGTVAGVCYYVMDYVPGQPLDTYVRLKQPAIKLLVGLMKQICEAVAYAHRRGVIHRDLKPMNILVGEDGAPCVLDFGLAKILSGDIGESGGGLVSMPGVLMGTLRYMSPEQTQGNPDAIDMRTDVYSLGVILYELLTASRPYDTDGDIRTAIGNIREANPARPSKLRREANSELDAIVLKAMDKQPQRRYQSAGELAEDLGAWLEGRPVVARSASSLYVLRKLAAKHYFHTTVIATLVLAIGAFAWIGMQGVFYGQQMRSERDASNTALANVDETARLAQWGVPELLHQMSLAWFFDAWHTGRLEEARAIRDRLPVDSPERMAMSFLLESRSIEEFQQQMPTRAATLMHLVIGERQVAAGNRKAAAAAFARSAEAANRIGNRWWQDLARARLAQVSGQPTSSAPSGGA